MKNLALIAGCAALLSASSDAAAQGGAATPPARQIFDNWMYTCEDGACQAVLSLASEETGERRLSWTFVYDPATDRLSSLVTVPLGVALPPGLRVKTSDGAINDWPFQVCDQEGCRAVAIIDDKTEAALESAMTVSLLFIPYGAKNAAALNVPMKGFAAAKKKLVEEAEKTRR